MAAIWLGLQAESCAGTSPGATPITSRAAVWAIGAEVKETRLVSDES